MINRVILTALVGAGALHPSRASAQGDTVRAVASSWAAQPAPGVDTASVYFNRGGSRQLGITYIETITKTPAGFMIVQQNVRPNGMTVSLDTIDVAAGSLAPLWHADATPRGRLRVQYTGDRMKGASTDSAGASTPVDAPVPAGALDFSTAGSFARLLPLKAGYAAVLLTNDVHRGVVPVNVRVTGEEEIEVAGRRMRTWAVETTSAGRATRHWIERATRREVKAAADMGNGATMEVERALAAAPAGAASEGAPVPTEALVGFYELVPGRGLTITLESGSLYGTTSRGDRKKLTHQAGTTYAVDGTPMTVTFTVGVDGSVTGLVLRQGSAERTLPKVR